VRRSAVPALVALPGVVLAVAGTTHPADLTHDTQWYWMALHIALMPVFPLLGASLVAVLPRGRGPLAWVVIVLAYLYAVFYTALDVLAGVGTGYLMRNEQEVTPAMEDIFDIGNDFARIGTLAFLVAAVLVAGEYLWRNRDKAALPAVLLVGASVSYVDSHIYRWRGVLTVLAIGIACAWLAVLRERGSGSPVA